MFPILSVIWKLVPVFLNQLVWNHILYMYWFTIQLMDWNRFKGKIMQSFHDFYSQLHIAHDHSIGMAESDMNSNGL